jgi:hypothetical protein
MGKVDWFECAGIFASVIISTFVSTLSEYKNEKTFKKLQEETDKIICKIYRNAKLVGLPINDLVKNKLSNEEDYAIMLSEVVLLDEYRELDELAALVKAEINYKRGDYVSALHLYNEFIKSKGRRYRGSEGRRMFSRGFVEHYFDCIDYFITNNSDEFVFDNDICDFLIPSYRYMAELSEDIVYPVEVYKRMEQLLYKGAKIYTSGAAMLYNILLHIEPDNPEWKRQYNRCFE